MQRLLSFITISFLALSAFAQSIVGVAPRNIVMGESFRVIYEIAADDVEDFFLDNLPDEIEVVMPPFGATTRESGKTVTKYTAMLCVEEEGTFTLPAPKAIIKGKEVEGKPLAITVSKASALPDQNTYTAQNDPPITEDKSLQNVKADYFARTVLSKKQVMQNEPVIVRVYIYARNTFEGLSGGIPELSDFYTLEMTKEGEVESTKEAINGHEYNKLLWAKYVMYPQRSGTLAIPSITFRGRVKVEDKSINAMDAALMNPMERFKVVSTTITAPAVQLNVTALPEQPEGFSGAVGKFSVRIKYADQSVNIDEPAVIKLVVKGNGNTKLMKAPRVSFPKQFTVHDMQISDSMQVTDKHGAIGEVVYTYTATANSPGEFKLPIVKFIYFDTDSNKYVTISKELPAITVGNEKRGETASLAPLKQFDDVSSEKNSEFMLSLKYFLVILIQFILFAQAWQLVKRYKKGQAEKAAIEEEERKDKETAYERRMIEEIRSRYESHQKTPLIIILLFFSGTLSAFNINVERANDAFHSGDYQKAIKLYTEELNANPSADVYYNLGNAYYEMREIGKAVQSYERAYILNANDPDIKNNLELAKSKVKDKLAEKNETFLVSWYRYIVYLVSADSWAVLSLIFLFVLLCSILVYRYSFSSKRSSLAFYGGMASAILFVLSSLFAIQQQWFINHSRIEVALSEDLLIYEKPEASSKVIVTIHEGETMEVIDDSMTEWKEIELSDGRRGWTTLSR